MHQRDEAAAIAWTVAARPPFPWLGTVGEGMGDESGQQPDAEWKNGTTGGRQAPPRTILLLDDDPGEQLVIARMLDRAEGRTYRLVWCEDCQTALDILDHQEVAACLVDYWLAEGTGLDFLEAAVSRHRDVPMILITGRRNRTVDLEASRRGACDFLIKDEIHPDVLERSIRYAISRKELERELRVAKMVAEKAMIARSKFLAAVNHDLRQPVQSLYFMVEVLAGKARDEQARKVLAATQAALHALTAILDGFLDISKLDAGGIEPAVSEMPLNPVLEQIAQEYSLRAEEKGLRLRLVPTSTWVRSDPHLLSRMLRNLMENALRYTDKGRIVLGCRRLGPELRIEVHDSGRGIPSEAMGAIWEEFYQVDNPTRDRRRGLGLGLPIVRRLADLLGHRLSVHSTLGQGSAFAITVPRVVAGFDRDIRVSMNASATATREGGVLVLDDDPLVLDALRLTLSEAGWQVLAARCIDDAVALAAMPGLRAIVSDYRLEGGRTGFDAVAAVRQACGMPLPAIILTADTAPEIVAAARAKGCLLYYKPVKASDLNVTVARCIKGDAH